MIDPDLKLQKPLEDYIDNYEAMSSRSLALFEPLIDMNFRFEDPYHKAIGVAGLGDLMRGRFGLYKKLRYKIYDFMWGRREATAYMMWGLSYEKPKAKRFALGNGSGGSGAFEGMSELTFSGNGQILSHRDFWGSHEGFDVAAYKSLEF